MIQKKIIICGQGSFVIAGSTVEFSLRIFTSEGELQLLNPITRILSAKYIPEKLISILVTMALNEQAEFVIEAAYFQNYFSEWLGYSSTSSVKFEILVMKVLEPIQIFDGFVMRLFESTGGKLSPHSKARFEISASIEINGKIVANFNEVIVRLSSLPLVWAECLKNMKEGDGVILQCTVNGENSEYFNGTGTDFDIEKYCISGNTDIIIKLHRFIIGKSAAKAIHRYCHEEINTINVLIENQEFKLACKKSENILKYLKEFNAEIFDDIVQPLMKRTGFLMIKLKKFKKAENVYEELSKSDPKNEILFYRLACAKIELKQIGTAKEILFQTMKNSKVSGNLKVEALSRQELIKISILENQENYKIAQKLY